jgi:hypothetical protein
MQVHSFDQLLDGLVMGVLLSNFLTENIMQEYFKKTSERMATKSIKWLMTRPLVIVFFALQVICLSFYFFLDH